MNSLNKTTLVYALLKILDLIKFPLTNNAEKKRNKL